MALKPFLCEACPGKGNAGVDFDVNGSCPVYTIDSFRQARGYKLEYPSDYPSDEGLIEMVSSGLYYYNEEEEDGYFEQGDYEGAALGVTCANTFLAGKCSKTIGELILQSEI